MQRDAKALVLKLECVSESPGRPTCLPGVYGSLGLELLYPNFSVRGGSKFEFR